jgi:hypothetical protein
MRAYKNVIFQRPFGCPALNPKNLYKNLAKMRISHENGALFRVANTVIRYFYFVIRPPKNGFEYDR